jgi:hypothetical protein
MAMPVSPAPSAVPPSLPVAALHGLRLLAQAQDYARRCGQDAREFALEIGQLWRAGLTNSEVRLLVFEGLIEHVRDGTRPGAARRALRHVANVRLDELGCVVLTGAGAALAGALEGLATSPLGMAGAADDLVSPGDLPRWDPTVRELWLGRLLVKRFRRPAPNQKCVLAAFQEEQWPERIHDPLPPRGDRDQVCTVHDTVVRLTRAQQWRLLHFRGDGTGQGVRWASVGRG